MSATFWSPQQRREAHREENLLRHYHDVLTANGVCDYTMEDLMNDYRFSIKLLMFSTIWDQVAGSSENYWRRKLFCLTGALKDHCPELFGSHK
jgi:hypothetical protein